MSKKYLITSALPYANGALHLGHLAGAYLPADIYVRYLRMLGMGIDDGFDIDGISPALVQAQDCLARQGGAGGKVLGAVPGVKTPPKVPDLTKPKTSGVGSGGGLGTRPGGALGTPAPKPQP